ncbi:MAG: exodeoxyribonuclease VII small subunit [Mailhella sp.]|nr:exodeoxyribonuclease VII small subunit [Mailhella sp.]
MKKNPTFEERMERLQEIVGILESGSSPLEQSVALYKEGLLHAAACREQLEKARHDISVCSEGKTSPFDAPAEADLPDSIPF